ncbi:MAG: TolC family protein [Gammaproteobacteria bacterium]|nr:TolC family protein [Gammaproteobacteria bacterium]
MAYFYGRTHWVNVTNRVSCNTPRQMTVFVLLVVHLTFTATATAQQISALTLAEAEEIALEREPGQVAYVARAKALVDQSVAAGQLADPKLRMGVANFPLESGGFTTEGMSQIQLGIRQAFPPGKTRVERTSRFRSQALEMTENANARGRDVLTAVRDAWLETYYWHQAIALLTESRPFFDDLVTITRSLYAVGSKDQQDVLRAELELSRLEDRLIEANRRRSQARALLSRWVGAASNRPLAAQLPSWQQLPAVEVMRTALVTHPSLSAASARIDARRAGVNLAKESYKPGWALDLGYGYRDGALPNGNPRSDFVSVALTVDIPLFRKNRQDRSLAAAHNERDAAIESKDELLRRLSSQLDAEYTRWQDLLRRIQLYERLILAQAKDQSNAALAAYQSEAGDFADVMRGYVDDLDIRLDYIRLQIEHAQSYAVLANLGDLPR